MQEFSRRAALLLLAGGLAGCGRRGEKRGKVRQLHPGETPELRRLINKYARIHDLPPRLIHRVVQRESGYNPAARNGPYYGLMQIHPQTAATMGYRGRPKGLLDAETNLKFAGKYLRGAYLVADGDQDAAIGWYARGYYYEAKRLGLLKQTGLR